MIAVVLEAAARSAALMMLAWLALALARPRNPHLHKALWTSVAIASLAMPLLMEIHLTRAFAAPMLEWTVRAHEPSRPHAVSTPALNACVYLLPALLLLWRFASGWWRMRCIRGESQALRAAWADGLDVRVSTKISSPGTFGRTILLPSEWPDWSRSKVAAVMAHESAHVRHRDCYALWLARLNACLFWFNPLAWWVARRLAALAEETSDEAALETLGNRADYAQILLGLAAQRSGTLALAMAGSNLSIRIERILSGVTLSSALKRWQLALAVGAVLPAVAAAAAPMQGATAPAAYSRMMPRVVSWASLDLASYYPAEAMRQGIEGNVELAITLDEEGHATDIQVITEDPLGMGFGAAASAAAHALQYSNPTGDTATFTVRFTFALKPHAR